MLSIHTEVVRSFTTVTHLARLHIQVVRYAVATTLAVPLSVIPPRGTTFTVSMDRTFSLAIVRPGLTQPQLNQALLAAFLALLGSIQA